LVGLALRKLTCQKNWQRVKKNGNVSKKWQRVKKMAYVAHRRAARRNRAQPRAAARSRAVAK
jgi:hypothetical protein